ncbi:hydrogenase nickel incorporation protein HypB [Candidatus Acetothermia bacterium]|jgi:hydrogenase nickel incorporation protein HypB|nr:hydrogenase nickel incorporation protein HypB [Candidatus Acetothermia bacterium]MCI2426012.1 hydrogenase nickel incorporation protein HypB [Candidatus Acetothermia bacterium]MCI2427071.1 hydrogenase nickel incorporation protein HypB [Candidatus Acetothermia bacterium]MCI2428338.1 hydrogenase nickel incorporation protein HypB [Candidatus Acetothermia bacterium]
MYKTQSKTEDLLIQQLEAAAKNYHLLQEHGLQAINVMGAIGSGKTELIKRLIEYLQREGIRVGVILGSISDNNDQQRFTTYKIPVYSLHTEEASYLDAAMVAIALKRFPLQEVDLLFIENVGNLVDPANFPLGTAQEIIVISATEGEATVRKYPKIFAQTEVLVINKIDLASVMEIDPQVLIADYMQVNPYGKTILTDAKTSRGMEQLIAALKI